MEELHSTILRSRPVSREWDRGLWMTEETTKGWGLRLEGTNCQLGGQGNSGVCAPGSLHILSTETAIGSCESGRHATGPRRKLGNWKPGKQKLLPLPLFPLTPSLVRWTLCSWENEEALRMSSSCITKGWKGMDFKLRVTDNCYDLWWQTRLYF